MSAQKYNSQPLLPIYIYHYILFRKSLNSDKNLTFIGNFRYTYFWRCFQKNRNDL